MDQDPYRCDDDSVFRERREHMERLRREARASEPLVRLALRRRARTAAGIAATIGFAAMCAVTVMDLSGGTWPPSSAARIVLWVAPIISLAVYGFVRIAGRLLGAPASVAARSDDARRDLELLREASPLADALRNVQRSEAASYAWPLIGVTLLLPLLIHGVVSVAVGGTRPFEARANDLDEWIRMSVVVVTHTHILVALLSARAGIRIASGLEKHPSYAALAVLAWGTLSAIVPTVLFAPPIVLATGLIPLIVLFHLTAWRARQERWLIAEAESQAADAG